MAERELDWGLPTPSSTNQTEPVEQMLDDHPHKSVPIGTRELKFIDEALSSLEGLTYPAVREVLIALYRQAYTDGWLDCGREAARADNQASIERPVSQQATAPPLTMPREEFELLKTVQEAVMHCPAGVVIKGFMLDPQRFLHEDGSSCEHTGTATVRMT